MATAAVGGMLGECTSATASVQAFHTPALKLLLRFLPFKTDSRSPGAQHPQQKHNRQLLLEELQRNPLWRWSSLDEKQPSAPSAFQTVTSQEAHSALLDYVRIAAEEEQQQQHSQSAHQYRRSEELSPAEAAAELHALYALAIVHVASQQQACKGHAADEISTKPSQGDLFDLLKAYAALDDASSCDKSSKHAQQEHSSHPQLDSQQSSAAAVQALYAFVQLADSVQQQQHRALQQQQHAGQLLFQNPSAGNLCSNYPSKQQQLSSSSCQSQGTEQDLRVLLELAQLDAQA